MIGGKPRARLHEPGVTLGDRNREPGADECALARTDLDAVARREIEPRVPRIRLRGDDGVVAQALNGELGHRRVP
jgi:hypothetical protein